MGPAAVQNPAALIGALKAQQPPANPRTPLERVNPDSQALEHIKAASVSLERATQFTNDPQMLLTFNAILGTLNKALLKFDGQQVMQSLQEAIGSFPPPVAPGMAGGPQPPQPSPGLGAGAPAAPPQGLGAPQGGPGIPA